MGQQTIENNLQSVIAAFTEANIIALPCQVRKCKLSVAVDTGATLNVISEHSFRELRGSLRGGRCRLLSNDMYIVGVTGYNLEIFGKVLLTVWPSRMVSGFRSYFCYEQTGVTGRRLTTFEHYEKVKDAHKP